MQLRVCILLLLLLSACRGKPPVTENKPLILVGTTLKSLPLPVKEGYHVSAGFGYCIGNAAAWQNEAAFLQELSGGCILQKTSDRNGSGKVMRGLNEL